MTYLLPQTPSGGGITLQGAWKFDTAITATDPGSKSFKFDNATLANITNIYINEITDNNNDASNILGIITTGNRLYIQQGNDAARAVLVEVSGPPVDNTGWWTIPVTVVNSLVLMQNNQTCALIIDLSGAAAAAGSVITNLAEVDMTAASTFDENSWPADIQGFKIAFWEVNQNGSTQGFTLRLRDTSQVNAGYDSVSVERLAAGGAGTINAQTIRFDVQGIGGLGISRGYFEGILLDPATNRWFVNGKFYDDFDDSVIDILGHVVLGSRLQGYRIQSAPASNYTAGFLATSYWT